MRRRQETGATSPPTGHAWFAAGPATFGSFIREQRIRTGMSRSTLAQRTRLSHRMVEDIECNRVTPAYSDVQTLAAAFGLNESELLKRVGYVGH